MFSFVFLLNWDVHEMQKKNGVYDLGIHIKFRQNIDDVYTKHATLNSSFLTWIEIKWRKAIEQDRKLLISIRWNCTAFKTIDPNELWFEHL